VRIDGRGFHKLSNHYGFAKPNDQRALDLMNAAAVHVVRSISDLCFAYGVSDEFSFVFDRNTVMFDRRKDKLVSTVVSTFTSAYTFLWSKYFTPLPVTSSSADHSNGHQSIDSASLSLDLEHLPTFDGRAVVYPTTANLRDYLSWRQVDCHINNLYNTTFWTLVQQGGLTQPDAEQHLKGTVSGDKNEILFSQFGVNYNKEPEMFRKGSCIFREYESTPVVTAEVQQAATDISENGDTRVTDVPEKLSRTQQEKQRKAKAKAMVVVRHLDIIKDDFWSERPWILSGSPPRGR
jgi:tRNA(His) guanylyltransferase